MRKRTFKSAGLNWTEVVREMVLVSTWEGYYIADREVVLSKTFDGWRSTVAGGLWDTAKAAASASYAALIREEKLERESR